MQTIELINDLTAGMNNVQIGKKYGVSEAAIRKWKRNLSSKKQ